MKAQWLVTPLGNGSFNVMYLNPTKGTFHMCGNTVENVTLEDVMEFAVHEGGQNGDGIFVNGSLVCLIGERFAN